MKAAIKTLKICLVAVLAIGLSGCTKSKTEGIISVINLSDSSPSSGATVTITVNGPNGNEGMFICNDGFTSQKVVKTSASGTTEKICFDLPAVLSISVSTTDGKSGVGTLNLIEEETTTATVKVN